MLDVGTLERGSRVPNEASRQVGSGWRILREASRDFGRGPRARSVRSLRVARLDVAPGDAIAVLSRGALALVRANLEADGLTLVLVAYRARFTFREGSAGRACFPDAGRPSA